MTNIFTHSAIFNSVSAINSVILTGSVTNQTVSKLSILGCRSAIGQGYDPYITSLTNLGAGSFTLSASETDPATIAKFAATLAQRLIDHGLIR